jgi:hypothetical protein
MKKHALQWMKSSRTSLHSSGLGKKNIRVKVFKENDKEVFIKAS